MANCKLCEEKTKEINRILKSYKKDKKKYQITIICLFVLNLFTLAFGASGLKMFFDLLKGFAK